MTMQAGVGPAAAGSHGNALPAHGNAAAGMQAGVGVGGLAQERWYEIVVTILTVRVV